MGGAKAGVLDNRGDGDARVVGRRKGDVERVVALVFRQARGVVAALLADGDGLRGAGLAARQVGRARHHAARGAFLRDADHAALDGGHVLGLVAQVLGRRQRQVLELQAERVLPRLDQVRHVVHATGRQRGRGVGQLQHGEVVVALADAERDGLAAVPLLLLGPLVGGALPVGRRQHAARFARDVDAGDLAKTQRLHEVVDGVDTHVVGQLVVVHVAGLDDAAVQIDRAQRVARAEGVAGKRPRAAVHDGGAGAALAGFQRGQRHEGLVGRAGRVGAADGAVEQRLVERVVQLVPGFVVDAFDKEVGVVRGLADEGQDLTVLWVDGDQRAAPLAVHLFDELLQLDVDRQPHRIARRRRVAGQPAHRVAAGRGFHLLDAGGAVQHAFVAAFHAQLADVVGAAVVGRLVGILDALFFLLVDAADVAHHVRAGLAHRVGAKQPRLDLDARKAVALGGKARHLFVGQAHADRQRFEVARILLQALEAAAVARRDLDHLRDGVNRLVGRAAQARGREFQRVGLVVGGQHDAVAVEDFAAVRHDRYHRRAVGLGALRQFFVPQHLQRVQPPGQQPERRHHAQRDHRQPHAKAHQIGFDVADFGHGET